MIENSFNKKVEEFILAANHFNVRMIMVGGTAVNYYGYKRHSADIDFWIDSEKSNLNNLILALQYLGYKINEFPTKVLQAQQNISIKISPELEIELITRFNPGRSFSEAYKSTKRFSIESNPNLYWHIISLEDLIQSKIISGRPKDLIDVQELKRINKEL